MVRTVALVGHAQSGKTTLAEALLYRTGVKQRVLEVKEVIGQATGEISATGHRPSGPARTSPAGRFFLEEIRMFHGIVKVLEVKGGISQNDVPWARGVIESARGTHDFVAFGKAAEAAQKAKAAFVQAFPREEAQEEGPKKVVLVLQAVQPMAGDVQSTALTGAGYGLIASEAMRTKRGNHLTRVVFRNYRGKVREDVFISIISEQPLGPKGSGVAFLALEALAGGYFLAREWALGKEKGEEEEEFPEELPGEDGEYGGGDDHH